MILDLIADIFLPFNDVMEFIKESISCLPNYILYTFYYCIAVTFLVSLISIVRNVFS